MFHRKSLESSVFKNPIIWTVWSWCLLKANHEDNEFPFNGNDITVRKGSFITGVEKGASECHISEQQWRTAMTYLKSTSRITTKSTNKYTVVTIYKWNDYQEDNKQNNKPVTNQQQTSNKPVTTNNNDNNVKNDNNDNKVTLSINSLIPLFEEINPSYKRLFSNTTERTSLKRLVDKYGVEWVEKLLKKLPEITSRPYAPRITTPYELENKLGQLKTFLQQEKNKVNKGGVVQL